MSTSLFKQHKKSELGNFKHWKPLSFKQYTILFPGLFVSLKVSYFFIMEKGEDRNKLIGKVQDEVVHALKIIHYLS